MTSSPLLAICIPTYKRPDQLRRCVASIIRSAGGRAVAIHVADDSADDTNVAVLEELKAGYPHLVHHRNPTNLGIDGNILHCVDLCDARYAWIMGEDDRVVPEAIPTVLDVLERREPAFVYVNYAAVDEDVARVIKERSLPLDRDGEESAEDFFAADAWSINFIGACVVNRALWGEVRSDRYVGTYFAHVGTILEYLRGRRVDLVARSLVLCRSGPPGVYTWRNSIFDVWHGWARMVDGLREVYPTDVCDRGAEAYRRAYGIGSVAFFAYLRADRAYDARAHDAYVRSGPYSPIARRVAWWIARAPPQPFLAARWALGALRRARNRRLTGY